MAYNPNLYNPYGLQQTPVQPTQMYAPIQQQAINGLLFIDNVEVLDTLRMPPGSVSQPYFLKDEDKFAIVTFDNVGGSTKEIFSFVKDPPMNNDSGEFVTREYFDQQISNIMEAINGKHVVQEAESAAEQEQS